MYHLLVDIFKHLYHNSILTFPTDKRVRKKEYYFADFAEWSFEIDLNTTSRYYIHSIRLIFITTLGVFMTNKTLDYYNKNSETFMQSTISADLKDMQNKFLNELNGNKILDFGCGSGRDTKCFIEAGYDVDAIDGSIELCKSASTYTGIQVKHMLFQDLDKENYYDGIWACSSILHLPKSELKDVLSKMNRALKDDGIIYTSFKYGDFEGERNGRFFTDFTLDIFKNFIKDVDNLMIKEYWITTDVRPGREEEKWLNLLLQKMLS